MKGGPEEQRRFRPCPPFSAISILHHPVKQRMNRKPEITRI